MNKFDILKKYDFYNNAEQSFKREIENASVAVKLKAGSPYFFEGEGCKQVALIGSGSVRVFKRGYNGREITLYRVMPGETCILTVSCVLGEKDYPASAYIETDLEAVIVDPGFFRGCVDSKPEVRKFVFNNLATRITNVLSLLEEVRFSNLNRRLCEYLVKSTANNNSRLPEIKITHEKIAAELGSAREVISRLLKELELKGAVEISRGKIVLIDRSKLETNY